MQFYLCHISIVPTVQKRLFKKEFDCSAIQLIEKHLTQNPTYIAKDKKGFSNLYFGNFKLDKSGRLLSLELGKQKERKGSDYSDAHFTEKKTIDYPHIVLLWDFQEQTILIEKNTAVFPKIEIVIRSIQEHFNKLIESYEMNVFLIPKTESGDFWRIINNFHVIYSISFELNQPNFFGESNPSVKEILECFKEETNALSVKTTIEHPRGNIKVLKTSKIIEKYLDWINKGGGTWTIRGKKNEKVKRRQKLVSTDNILTENILDDDIGKIEENAETVISMARNIYETKRPNTKDIENK